MVFIGDNTFTSRFFFIQRFQWNFTWIHSMLNENVGKTTLFNNNVSKINDRFLPLHLLTHSVIINILCHFQLAFDLIFHCYQDSNFEERKNAQLVGLEIKSKRFLISNANICHLSFETNIKLNSKMENLKFVVHLIKEKLNKAIVATFP